ncbi:MAG: bifunctional folylpolyglutamate synthase/dihydrofolate synthase [Saprospiraceae bacterium]|jgi:dihydrofolate synthase/folylpolyglutamate synthase|nr:bifunctional folylpolyglutamate synthase/dihydrofolate synthase [Saprospiraceae bacterium]
MLQGLKPAYQDTLQYIFEHLPMFQRIGAAAYRKDLTNITALTELLGNPQQRFPSIHVAGTNGKGSVSFMLAAILQAHGLKTGLYVSPHYKDFRERIRINGAYIPRRRVVDFVNRMKPAIENIKPSFFEISAAMAFEYFADEKVDVAVIETGMGGRLDSTNIIQPLLSVITNISYDHMQWLGDTLEAIAGEKAGIIKANIPVVIGESHPETQPVFIAHATRKNAPIVFADAFYRVSADYAGLTHTRFSVIKDNKALPVYEVNIHGDYQAANLATVLQAVDTLSETGFFDRKDASVREGLYRLKPLTGFMGRWQVLGRAPLIIADSAHNEAGLKWVFSQLAGSVYRQLHIVTGFVNDKDIERVLPLFPPKAVYYFAKANIPRGLEAESLRQLAATYQLNGKAYVSVKNALRAAKRHASPDDLILITGSVFVVAETL